MDGAVQIISGCESSEWKPFSPRLGRTDLPAQLANDKDETVARIENFKRLMEPRVRSLVSADFARRFSQEFSRNIDTAYRTLDSLLFLGGLGVAILGVFQSDVSQVLGGLTSTAAGSLSSTTKLWELTREGVGSAYRESRTFLMTNDFSRTIGAYYDSVWQSLNFPQDRGASAS